MNSWVNKGKVLIVKKALDKGELLGEKYSWTIYCLVDLKVVYILTYAYISIVNLISSTANSEATSDTSSMMLFNVTLSPKHMNAEVASISDAILWNCRRESVTNQYYRFLYGMLFTAMGAVLVGFLVTKFISLVIVSCTCKDCCSWPWVLNEYGLTKLWHIAILEQLEEACKNTSQTQQSILQKNHQ